MEKNIKKRDTFVKNKKSEEMLNTRINPKSLGGDLLFFIGKTLNKHLNTYSTYLSIRWFYAEYDYGNSGCIAY